MQTPWTLMEPDPPHVEEAADGEYSVFGVALVAILLWAWWTGVKNDRKN